MPGYKVNITFDDELMNNVTVRISNDYVQRIQSGTQEPFKMNEIELNRQIEEFNKNKNEEKEFESIFLDLIFVLANKKEKFLTASKNESLSFLKSKFFKRSNNLNKNIAKRRKGFARVRQPNNKLIYKLDRYENIYYEKLINSSFSALENKASNEIVNTETSVQDLGIQKSLIFSTTKTLSTTTQAVLLYNVTTTVLAPTVFITNYTNVEPISSDITNSTTPSTTALSTSTIKCSNNSTSIIKSDETIIFKTLTISANTVTYKTSSANGETFAATTATLPVMITSLVPPNIIITNSSSNDSIPFETINETSLSSMERSLATTHNYTSNEDKTTEANSSSSLNNKTVLFADLIIKIKIKTEINNTNKNTEKTSNQSVDDSKPILSTTQNIQEALTINTETIINITSTKTAKNNETTKTIANEVLTSLKYKDQITNETKIENKNIEIHDLLKKESTSLKTEKRNQSTEIVTTVLQKNLSRIQKVKNTETKILNRNSTDQKVNGNQTQFTNFPKQDLNATKIDLDKKFLNQTNLIQVIKSSINKNNLKTDDDSIIQEMKSKVNAKTKNTINKPFYTKSILNSTILNKNQSTKKKSAHNTTITSKNISKPLTTSHKMITTKFTKRLENTTKIMKTTSSNVLKNTSTNFIDFFKFSNKTKKNFNQSMRIQKKSIINNDYEYNTENDYEIDPELSYEWEKGAFGPVI